MEQDTKLLPVAKLHGKEYLVDVGKREFRNFRDSDDVIGMHSLEGKRMVRDMLGLDWKSHGLPMGTM